VTTVRAYSNGTGNTAMIMSSSMVGWRKSLLELCSNASDMMRRLVVLSVRELTAKGYLAPKTQELDTESNSL